jgi:hypothetical protein
VLRQLRASLAWISTIEGDLLSIRPEQVLRGTKESAFSCLYYAVLNFFVWAGVEPPTLEAMRAYVALSAGVWAARVDEPVDRAEWGNVGITIIHALALLHEFSFPRLVALARIPKDKTARDVFARLLASGYGVLFSVRIDFTAPDAGYSMAHALAACGWSDEWVEAMDSNPPCLTGRLIPYVDDGSCFDSVELAASVEALPHGAVTRYGWQTIADDAPAQVNGEPARGLVGIDRLFLMALPEGSGDERA